MMRWDNKGRQFDEIAKEMLKEECKYYIWGAGVFGEAFYKEFKDELNIISFIDSDLQKQKGKFCNLDVFSPSKLKIHKKGIKILVSAGWTKEIFSQLNTMGYILNKDFFHIDEFTAIYMMYKYNKLHLTNLTYIITEKCTLKCRDCCGFYPYYKDPANHSLEEIMRDLEIYFQWVDQLNVLGLCGGDAMMHPCFNQILEEVGRRYYGKKVMNIEIYTNAVIIPTKEQISLFRKYDVFYRFTDYGEQTRGKQKVKEVVQLLEENQIRYDKVQFASWYESGYPQESNGITKEKELMQFFDNCNRRSCQEITKGKFFYCGAARNAADIGYCPLEPGDSFSLVPYEEDKKMLLMEYALGYTEKGYLNYCKKCNGGQNSNQHKIQAGIQL